ncbi:MAG: hypothetical protein AAGA85_09560 [Bacteroidota bacterium]
MKTIEQIAVSIAFLGVMMKMMAIAGGDTVLAASLLILAFSYSPFGLFLFNHIPVSRWFDRKAYMGMTAARALGSFAVGVVCSVLVTGILFKLLQLPGAREMMWMGFVGVGMLGISVAFRSLSGLRPGAFARGLFRRAAVWVVLAFALYMTPGVVLVEAFYRQHPEYIEAYKRAAADPQNERLQWEAEEIRSQL